jgi:hypothetical protein
MSLTENNLARDRAQESTSLTSTAGSIIALVFLGGALAAAPLVLFEKHVSYKAIEMQSVKSQISNIIIWADTESYFQPKTGLGKKLLEIRNMAISKGFPLLNVEEILLEVSHRRGEPTSA